MAVPLGPEHAPLVARILVKELSFSVEPSAYYKSTWVRRLYDRPPLRGELSFQTIQGMDVPKHAIGLDLADDEMKNFFCMAHSEFTPASGMDIDHAFPQSSIHANQTAFFIFLNTAKHQTFANVLLQEKGMSDFFRRDQDHKIKGTGYFYKICYNDMENLWLLCHACNIHKSNIDSLQWFQKQTRYFGEPFIKEVDGKGGLQSGIILDRIYPRPVKKIPVMGFGRHLVLNEGTSIGLGRFAREWFAKQHKQDYKLHKQYYSQNSAQFKLELEHIQTLKKTGKFENAERYFRRCSRNLKMLHVVQQKLHFHAGEISSSSQSDSSSVDEARQEDFAQRTTESLYTFHNFKQLRSLLNKHYGKESAESLLSLRQTRQVDQNGFQAIGEAMVKFLEKAARPLSLKEGQQKLKRLLAEYKTASSAEARELRRDAEQEKTARLTAENLAKVSQLKAEAERQERLKLEAELAAFRRDLVKNKPTTKTESRS